MKNTKTLFTWALFICCLSLFATDHTINNHVGPPNNLINETIISNTNLDPNKAPSENFDLSRWNMTISSGDEISVSTLSNKYVSDEFFTSNDGGMVFKNIPYDGGTTPNSSYTRVELREMLRGDNEDISATGITKNNWVLSTASSKNQSDAGGVGGLMTATLKINRTTTTSDEIWQVGRMIIGQIHGKDNEPIRVYYHKQPNHNKGAIYIAHEPKNDNPERFYNILGEYINEDDLDIGWQYVDAPEPENGIALNEEFSYKIQVIDDQLYFFLYNESGNQIGYKKIDMSNSGYEDDYLYFKAGVYSGNRTVKEASDYNQATFYELYHSHGADAQVISDILNVSSLDQFSANGGTQTIDITSDKDWSISEDSSWITLNKTSGSNNDSITVTVSENTSTNARSATITVTDDSITRFVTVSQVGEGDVVNPADSCSEGSNLTLNGTIDVFSAEENSTNTVQNILNEDNDSRWSAETFPQFATIDLGAIYNVNEISLSPYLERDYQFTVEGSPTSASSDFSMLVDASNNTISSGLITKSFNASNVRYVKLTITGAATYDGVWSSINYLKVNCAGNDDEGETDPVNPITLNPDLSPSGNFDLSKWNLGVPIDRGDGISTTITVEDLNNGYELKDNDDKDYFYTASDGGMVFKNYPKNSYKTSEGTKYSRTELRELLASDDERAKDPDNNWYFSSSNNIPSNAGGIDGVLTATLAVNKVTTDGDSNHKGRVVIGQIHASSNEPNRLYYHKLPEHDKGAIYVAHEEFDGDQTFYNIIGDYIEDETSSDKLNDDIEEPADGIELDEQFSYKIEVIGNDQWVTISRPGKDDVVKYIDMSESGYENDWMYFKAGIYSQNDTTDLDNDYDQATFYSLLQTHNDDTTLSNPDTILGTLNENVTVYPNPFTSVINVDFSDNLIVPVAKVKVIDVLGREIISMDRDLQENSMELQANFNSTGFYFIQLLDANDKIIATKKVINK